MTPEQFEHFVANLFSEMGYVAKVSSLSNDWGIDVIATKDTEKIAIQAKKYGGSSRSVNRRMIMELYGAAAYQDCTSAVLATDGDVLPDAVTVAKKLGIKILRLSAIDYSPDIHRSSNEEKCEPERSQQNNDNGYPSFELVWEKYIMPLRGKTISNDRLSNTIKDVTLAGLIRITSNGLQGRIDIEGFKLAYNTLIRNSEISRDYINQQVDKRCSSGIVLILGQIPFIEITSHPKGLKLK